MRRDEGDPSLHTARQCATDERGRGRGFGGSARDAGQEAVRRLWRSEVPIDQPLPFPGLRAASASDGRLSVARASGDEASERCAVMGQERSNLQISASAQEGGGQWGG
jgi:hypothetical protein